MASLGGVCGFFFLHYIEEIQREDESQEMNKHIWTEVFFFFFVMVLAILLCGISSGSVTLSGLGLL